MDGFHARKGSIIIEQSLAISRLRWTASKGDDAFWIGGPRHDHDDHNSLEGGYVFLETSSLSEGEAGAGRESALIESPLLTTTGSKVKWSPLIGLDPSRHCALIGC